MAKYMNVDIEVVQGYDVDNYLKVMQNYLLDISIKNSNLEVE